MTPLTVSQAIAAAQTLGLDRLDAQLLLLHALSKPDTERAWLLAHDADALSEPAAEAFRHFSLRRAAGEPLAYIVGYKDFFGLRLNVDARVLVPRPDTETLVQWVLDVTQGLISPDILDLGTGSGAVGIAIAHHLKCRVTATDFSTDALAVASQNAAQLGMDMQFIRSNWLENVSGQYQVIASNPPYIVHADPHLAALTHEPLNALVAGQDGLRDIRQIVDHAPKRLLPGGWLLLEHGYDQAAAVRRLLASRGFAKVQSRMDLAGIARCSGGQWDN
ncbi:MAG: peptide chain release factor N(5)-glutamine methyltransferase [Polaromonas sp.]